ncbi:MAG TPA: helix-turn-helix transcriptional regulator [Caulobacteraceae bacterium]|nr:helix-turn-helix transcriptional regulator [Caulobacteraceae bacterium]
MTDDQALHNIATNLKRLRVEKGLSMAALAREINDYPATIKRIEDEACMPGAGLLTRIAEALGSTANDLLAEPPSRKLSHAS